MYLNDEWNLFIQRGELNTDFFSWGLGAYAVGDECITKEDYDKKHQDFADRLQRLNIELDEYTKADCDYQTTVATVFSLAQRAKQIFESSEVQEKRALLSFLLQNPTVNGKNLEFSLVSPFDLILNLSDCPDLLAWQDAFRTYEWEKVFPDPRVSLSQIQQLLMLAS